jgi:hypothetical protein
MDDSDITFVDIIVLLVLFVLVFLMAWVIKITNNIQDSKIDSVCKKGFSLNLKKGQIFSKVLLGKSIVIPPEDLPINFNLNC